jgi:hypothetical protein
MVYIVYVRLGGLGMPLRTSVSGEVSTTGLRFYLGLSIWASLPKTNAHSTHVTFNHRTTAQPPQLQRSARVCVLSKSSATFPPY